MISLVPCARCGKPGATIQKWMGHAFKLVCEDCRYTPKQRRMFRQAVYHKTIRRAVPDLLKLPAAARIREELAVRIPRKPNG